MNKENDNDLISRSELKNAILEHRDDYVEDNFFWTKLFDIIDNATPVDIKDEIAGAYNEGYMCGNKEAEKERLQGEPVIKCQDCKYRVKEWREDKRMKEKGYWVYGCKHFGEIMGYWGFGGNDNEFCSDAERKEW